MRDPDMMLSLLREMANEPHGRIEASMTFDMDEDELRRVHPPSRSDLPSSGMAACLGRGSADHPPEECGLSLTVQEQAAE